MDNNGLRKGLLTALLVTTALPMLNHLTGIIKSGALNGDVRLARDTVLTRAGWWSGGYQQQKEAFLNDCTGFRPDLVRLNNQIDYAFFGKVHANGVVIGRQEYLYEQGYIDACYGRNFLGEPAIRRQLAQLRYLKDTLAKAGKRLMVAFAPSKARLFPEYIPDFLKSGQPGIRTNYEVMTSLCRQWSIPFIDYNAYFLSMKGNAPFPLFSKKGIHWTLAGAALAADTLNHFLARLTGRPVPEISWDNRQTVQTPEARSTDDDIAKGINLIWPLAEETYYYPVLGFGKDTARRPRVIFISDSFFWPLLSQGIPQHCYKDWEFWYYFNELWTEATIGGKEQPGYERDNNWMDRLQHADAVVLLYTEVNLTGLGSGFIEKAYTRFGGR